MFCLKRSLTREHTTTVDLELMASTPPPSSCPYSSSMSDFPHGGNGATPGQAGSLLDASPSGDGGCGEMMGTGDSPTTSFLSSQNCDVVLQTTGSAASGGNGGCGGGNNGNNGTRRSERYKDTRQVRKRDRFC
jgi:hypothetical protein